jgi:hypothetical protein
MREQRLAEAKRLDRRIQQACDRRVPDTGIGELFSIGRASFAVRAEVRGQQVVRDRKPIGSLPPGAILTVDEVQLGHSLNEFGQGRQSARSPVDASLARCREETKMSTGDRQESFIAGDGGRCSIGGCEGTDVDLACVLDAGRGRVEQLAVRGRAGQQVAQRTWSGRGYHRHLPKVNSLRDLGSRGSGEGR